MEQQSQSQTNDAQQKHEKPSSTGESNVLLSIPQRRTVQEKQKDKIKTREETDRRLVLSSRQGESSKKKKLKSSSSHKQQESSSNTQGQQLSVETRSRKSRNVLSQDNYSNDQQQSSSSISQDDEEEEEESQSQDSELEEDNFGSSSRNQEKREKLKIKTELDEYFNQKRRDMNSQTHVEEVKNIKIQTIFNRELFKYDYLKKCLGKDKNRVFDRDTISMINKEIYTSWNTLTAGQQAYYKKKAKNLSDKIRDKKLKQEELNSYAVYFTIRGKHRTQHVKTSKGFHELLKQVQNSTDFNDFINILSRDFEYKQQQKKQNIRCDEESEKSQVDQDIDDESGNDEEEEDEEGGADMEKISTEARIEREDRRETIIRKKAVPPIEYQNLRVRKQNPAKGSENKEQFKLEQEPGVTNQMKPVESFFQTYYQSN